eukprot:6814685-Alexandrium_andersonii.AAC.1
MGGPARVGLRRMAAACHCRANACCRLPRKPRSPARCMASAQNPRCQCPTATRAIRSMNRTAPA